MLQIISGKFFDSTTDRFHTDYCKAVFYSITTLLSRAKMNRYVPERITTPILTLYKHIGTQKSFQKDG